MTENATPANVGSNDGLGVSVPKHCKICAHRYNDVEEGHNCRHYDATIVLSGGTVLKWPGQSVASDYVE
jgi:hypothetical protein